MDRKFGSQLSGMWREFREFVVRHRKTGWFTALIILASWGVLAFRTDIGVDTEIMISFPENMLKSWCGIGRWGLVFTKRLLGLGKFSQPAAVIASMAALWVLCMGVNFAVYQWSGQDERYGLFYPVFSAVYVTSPCLAEQFYFLLQCFEVIWGILLAVAAVYGTSRYVYHRESPWWLAAAVFCGVWALGSYQAMACVFIGLSAFSFLLAYQRDEGEEKKGKWFGCAVSFVAVFLVMLAGYIMVSGVVSRAAGEDSGYIGDMILWKREAFRNCLYYIKVDMMDIYFGRKVFYSVLGLPVLLLGTALFLRRGWNSGKRERLLYVMAGGFFIFSPTCITILTGFYQGVRVQMAYPFVLALSCGVLTTVVWGGSVGEEKDTVVGGTVQKGKDIEAGGTVQKEKDIEAEGTVQKEKDTEAGGTVQKGKSTETREDVRKEKDIETQEDVQREKITGAGEDVRWEKNAEAREYVQREKNIGAEENVWKRLWNRREMAGTVAALCLCGIVAWSQWIISQRLLDTMHMVSDQDIRKCEDIYREAQALAAENGQDIRDKSLVFVGIQEGELGPAVLRGDMIGHSLFQWDPNCVVGVSERVGNLMHAVGLSHKKASQAQYEEGKVRAASMPCWPVEGSIVLEGDMVIIKLSEPIY